MTTAQLPPQQGLPPLQGLKVVDFGHYIAGPLLGMLLADAGAEVTKIDPPGGPRWASNANAMLQRGKQQLTLDLTKADQVQQALALAASADIVIENFRPGVMERFGLGPEVLREANPRLIYCRIPGFARQDPRSAMPGWDSVVAAATSVFRPMPQFPGGPPVREQPTFIATPFLSTYAAVVAAHATVAALIGRGRTGRGDVVDVPLYDAAFEIFGAELQFKHDFASGGFLPPVRAGLGHYQGSDGRWIHLCLFEEYHLQWFIAHFAPEWLDEGMGDRQRLNADPELHDELASRLTELIATRPAAQWEDEMNNLTGAPGALCLSTDEGLRHDDHAIDSRAVVELDDPELGTTRQLGQPVVLTGTPLQPRPRPTPGEAPAPTPAQTGNPTPSAEASGDDTAPQPPLDGMLAVDFTQVLAGPTAGRILAEYGAEVVKINKTSDHAIMCHAWINTGKRSLLLDLKAPGSQPVLAKLFEQADVVSQNFALGVADRLGIGAADTLQAKPDTVYVSINAFGPTGRRATWRGREELGQAVAGLQNKWRDEQGVPAMLTFPVCDIGTGHLAALGALLALYARQNGHPGQEITASLAHTASFLQAPSMLWSERDGTEPDPPADQEAIGWGPLHRLYRGADAWFVIVADGLADRIDRIEGLQDVSPSDAEALAKRFATEPAAAWCERIVAAGGAAHVVVPSAEILEDPIAWDRGLLVNLGGDHLSVGVPPRLAETPLRSGRPSDPGSDAPAVVAELGLDHLWNDLIQEQAIVVPDP